MGVGHPAFGKPGKLRQKASIGAVLLRTKRGVEVIEEE